MVNFPANDRIIQFVATAAQTVFAYDYPVLDEQDIVVVQEGVTLVLTTDYTVQGVGNQAGGTITLVVGATVNDAVTIFGDQPVERLTDFTFGGAFNSGTVNLELDKLTQQAQEADRNIDGCIRTDFEDIGRVLNAIPDKAARLDRVLGFDATTGQPVVSTVLLSDINDFVGGVITFEGRTGTVVSAGGDYTASEITNVAGGGIAATDVQAAIDELDTEKAAALHAANHTDGTDDIQNATASVKGLATAAQITKLDGIETGATGDQSDAEIKTAYENNADTNEFSDAEQTKLAGIETGATADQSDAEIKTAYENNADTNEFSDAEQTKLAGIATGAEVNPDVVSQAEAEAGVATTERIWTAERVKQAIEALETTGVSQLSDLSDVNTSTPTNRFVLVADGVDFESRLLVELDISDLQNYSLVGHTHVLADVTDSGALAALNTVGTSEIDNSAVTFAKIQNVSATDRILGRDTAGAGVIEEITPANVKAMLAIVLADISDSGALAALDTVDTAEIDDDAVTYAKMQNVVADDRILGNIAGAGGIVAELTDAQVRTMINVADGANLYVHPNHSGDVTSVGDGAQTIANSAVTFAKFQNVKENSLLGRFAAGSGVAIDIDETDLAEEGTPAAGMFIPGWDAAGGLVKFDIGDLPTGGGGEINTMSNAGTGLDIFNAKSGVDFPMRALIGDSGVTITLDGSDLDINLDINSLAIATIAAGDFVPFWDITATATNKKITFANFEATLDHDNLAGFVAGEHFLQSAITEVGTVTTGNVDAVVSAATESLAGKIELATQAEADTGSDDARAITPLKLDERLKGFRAVNAQTGTSYVAVAADAGKLITMNNGSASTLTINDSVFSAGDVVHIMQIGAGAVTINGSASNDTQGSKTLVMDGISSQVVVVIHVGGASTLSTVTGELV